MPGFPSPLSYPRIEEQAAILADPIEEQAAILADPIREERETAMRFQNMLIPTDCSAAAEATVQQALAFAAHEQAHVLLLHVLPSPFVTGTEETLQAHVDQRLQAMAHTALVPVQRLVTWGNPGAEICRVAIQHHSDLIVMTTHGYTGLALEALGSVADVVIRQAPCAVLILRASPTSAASS
jgi:universal stress protein A